MAYAPQAWHDAPATDTPISAVRLGVLEAGLQEAASVADAAAPSASPALTGAATLDAVASRRSRAQRRR